MTTSAPPTNFVALPGAPEGFSSPVVGHGQIAGNYVDDNLGIQRGFVYSGGTYTPLDAPSSTGTLATGIDDSGEVAGYYFGNDGNQHGFVYNGTAASPYTTIDDPNQVAGTVAQAINNAGDVVGYYIDGFGQQHGFLDSGGKYTTLDPPGSGFKQALGINNSDQVVGQYGDGHGTHGFLLSGSTYTLRTIAATNGTIAQAINDAGEIVTYIDANVCRRTASCTTTASGPISTSRTRPTERLLPASAIPARFPDITTTARTSTHDFTAQTNVAAVGDPVVSAVTPSDTDPADRRRRHHDLSVGGADRKRSEQPGGLDDHQGGHERDVHCPTRRSDGRKLHPSWPRRVADERGARGHRLDGQATTVGDTTGDHWSDSDVLVDWATGGSWSLKAPRRPQATRATIEAERRLPAADHRRSTWHSRSPSTAPGVDPAQDKRHESR